MDLIREPALSSAELLQELAARLGLSLWCDATARALAPAVELPRRQLDIFLREVHAEDRGSLATAAREAARLGTVLTASYRTAGSPVRFMRIAAEVRQGAEDLVLACGIAVDESRLVTAEARLASVAETTPAMLWVMEPNGFCSFFSHSWYEYTGQSPQAALGMGWLKTVHPQDLELATDCAIQAAQRRMPFRVEHRLRHREGDWRWVRCTGNPRFDPQGRYLGQSGVVTDIHEWRAAPA